MAHPNDFAKYRTVNYVLALFVLCALWPAMVASQASVADEGTVRGNRAEISVTMIIPCINSTSAGDWGGSFARVEGGSVLLG